MPKSIVSYTFVCILCGLICIPPLVNAQNSQDDYKIHVGDRLDIYIEGYPEYSRQLSVLPNGMISYPRIGDVRVAGMTPAKLSELISQNLAGLNYPTVYVSVLMAQQREVYVQGMVKTPGRYFFDGDSVHLLQALALAGGLDHEKADMKNVRVFRNGQLLNSIDISGLLNGDAEIDLELQSKDMVLVPSRLQQRLIAVTGAVVKPDGFSVEEERIHVLRALWMASGPLQDISDLENAVVIHPNSSTTQVDLKQLSQDPTLQSDRYMMSPGDVLYIPNAYVDEKVSVIGEVKSPGQYAVKGSIDVLEALSLAGGLVEDRANLKKAFIQRRDGSREPVNLMDLFDEDAKTAGLMLHPGDTLSIPKRLKVNWNALYTVVLTASLIYNIATR